MFKLNVRKFRKMLETCDIFGEPIQFSLNLKYLQKSFFGGIMTFLLICFFVMIAFSGFSDLIDRRNILSFTQEIYHSVPPLINFSSRKMKLALSFNNYLINDPRYFKLELIQGFEIRDDNGTKNYNFINQEIHPCTANHFSSDILPSLHAIDSNISHFLCPQIEMEINVRGAYSSQVFSYFWIKLSKCQNTPNVTCFSDDVIEETFIKMGRVYLDIYFTNNIINANDYLNPVNSFLDDRIYVLIDKNSYKEKNFFFTQNKIYTDSSILTTKYDLQLETYVYENVYDETVINIDPSNSDITYAGIFFRSNILGKSHVRTFEKAGKFLGYIGGFWSILHLFFSFVSKKYNRFKLLMKMANSLYQFSGSNERKSKKLLPSLKKTRYEAKGTIGQTNILNDKIRDFLKKDKELKLGTGFRNYLKRKLALFYYNIFPKENPNTDQLKLQEHALIAIQKDTDIVQLLTKIKEIDKFKNIFFTSFQQKLFDFFSKERISRKGREKINISRTSISFLRKSYKISQSMFRSSPKLKKNQKFIRTSTLHEISEVENLYEAFKQAWKSQNEGMENFQINDRILKCFDKDLLKYFEEKYNKEEGVDESKKVQAYF